MQEFESGIPSERSPLRIGRYELVCKLGAGGMADVFLAHQPGPFAANKLVVIKQLRASGVDDPQFVNMFADESRIAVRLNHPNVVHTYDVVAEDRDYYLTLEFLHGKSLYAALNRITREAVPLALHLWVLTQVLEGLAYAHDLTEFDGSPLGIVHRDVSPSNVFLTFEGDVKLLDFGIAKSVGAISSTRDGVVKGKLGYASPEQCLGEPVDKRSDLFAVGVMLWEAIAKRKRALGGTEASMFQSRVEGTEQRIEDACPDVPEVLVAMCERALARNPTERYASAQEFRLAIEDYLRSTKFEGGREQLQQLLRTHFETEMLDLRRRIDEHLGEARSRSSRPPRPGELPSELMQEVPRPSRLPDLASVRTQANSSGRDELAPAARRPSKHGRIALFVLCAVALGLAAVAAIRLNSNEPLPATRLAPQAALPAAAKANDTNESSPQRAQISVALEVAPAKVELRLDGRLIANPYRATHSRDELLHHLSARLTGYETVELELRYDHDVELSLALEKSKTLVAPLIRGATPGGRTKGGLGSSLPGTVGRASDVVQPGEDLRGQAPRSRTRDLDETDPYKR